MENILDKYVSKSEKIAYRLISDEVVIMTPDDSMLHTLNEVASKLFQNINGRKSVRELCDIIFDSYDVPKEKLEQDVIGFITEMAQKNILLIKNAPTD